MPGSIGAEIVMVKDLSPATSDCKTGALGARFTVVPAETGVMESVTATNSAVAAPNVRKVLESDLVFRADI